MNLSPTFTRLEFADLVRRLNDADLAYIFKHGLVQETAYSSMLKQDRRRLHRLIGESLERAYPDALEENAARLAQHFDEANDAAKTFRYANLAGDAAARIYANPEAITFYSLARRVATSLDFDTAEWIALYTKLGRVYEVSSQFDRALALYQEMEQLAVKKSDEGLLLAALLLSATLFATPTPLFDETRGRAALEPVLALARKLQDGEAEAKIYWIYLLLNGFNGHSQAAVEYGEKGVALARALGLKERLAYLLNDISTFGYFATGEFQKGLATALEARQLWEELGNLPMLTDNLNNSAIFDFLKGDYALVAQDLGRSYEIAETINNLWGISLARMDLGMLEFERGQMEKAILPLRRSCDDMIENGLGMMLIGSTILSLVYAELGAIEEGFQTIDRVIGKFEIAMYRAPSQCTYAYLTFLRGDVEGAKRILAAQGDLRPENVVLMPLGPILLMGELGLAEKNYQEVINTLGSLADQMASIGVYSYVADAFWFIARAHHALGEVALAKANLLRARELAERLGSPRSLWKILMTLGALERQAGNPLGAERLQDQARAIVHQIAAHTPEQYRAGFIKKTEMGELSLDVSR